MLASLFEFLAQFFRQRVLGLELLEELIVFLNGTVDLGAVFEVEGDGAVNLFERECGEVGADGFSRLALGEVDGDTVEGDSASFEVVAPVS